MRGIPRVCEVIIELYRTPTINTMDVPNLNPGIYKNVDIDNKAV